MGERQDWIEAVLDGQGRALRTRGLHNRYGPRKLALEQAVIWANAQAHAVRNEPSKVVEAAEKFAAFLEPPDPAE